MTGPMRLMLLCPGRGSYGREQLGSLPSDSPVLDGLDAFRADLGRATLRQMDSAERFGSKLHVAGENASILTFGATLADLEALDPSKGRLVCVAGNSMGWYTALGASGALPLPEAARLVETMGGYQAGNVLGGQVLYPTTDEDWRPDPLLQRSVDEALTWPGVELSIRLGGVAVLAGPREAVRRLLSELPELVRGPRSFPMQLPLHSAFHTSVMQGASERAAQELGDLEMRSPLLPLIDGLGRLHARWADPALLLDYTLGAQVTETFDLSACLRAGLQDYAPDAVLLPGPGETLGGAVAQVMIGLGWRGLRDRQDFFEAQSGPRPVVVSMCRPDQRAWVA